MAVERTYYTIDPEGKLTCMKCKVPLVKGKAKFMYLENGFPVEMPVCPKCGFVYVPEELADDGTDRHHAYPDGIPAGELRAAHPHRNRQR